MINYYQYNDRENIGDCLSEVILPFFLPNGFRLVDKYVEGKLCAVGSIMDAVKDKDTVWGTGIIKEEERYNFKNTKFLAVRGKLTRDRISGVEVPEVYGDPALLLPLMYNPKIKKTKKVGYIYHYVDKIPGDSISVTLYWKDFIDKVLECEKIVSSSLHGLIIAEAYGIPATWKVYSDRIVGGEFKFHDYLTGTGREIQSPGKLPPIQSLDKIQQGLINALKKHYE